MGSAIAGLPFVKGTFSWYYDMRSTAMYTFLKTDMLSEYGRKIILYREDINDWGYPSYGKDFSSYNPVTGFLYYINSSFFETKSLNDYETKNNNKKNNERMRVVNEISDNSAIYISTFALSGEHYKDFILYAKLTRDMLPILFFYINKKQIMQEKS
jgi:hypothetical protein